MAPLVNPMYLSVFLICRPEAQGILCATVYLMVVFLFIPVPFYKYLSGTDAQFPHHEVSIGTLN